MYLLLAVPLFVVGLFCLVFLVAHLHYRNKFLGQVVRIFEEKPLFVIPRGTIDPTAEDVVFTTSDGIQLSGCYLHQRAQHRRGVILFGLEFGSNRWAAVPYAEKLRDAGYDVFAYEPRNQGDSEIDPSYKPLQWVTDKDVLDGRAALDYLKDRPDANAHGIGLFGISKGGSVGLMLAAEDPAIRCIVTDGAFATYTTVVPYMRRWVSIYSAHKRIQKLVPDFFYGSIGLVAMNRVAKSRGVRFPWVESAVRRLKVPLLMIHGQADTYIKPEMAETLRAICHSAGSDIWIVPNAKHNQAPHVEPEKYPAKLVAFFETYLGSSSSQESSQTLAPVAATRRTA
jgi:uncharacterized protein